MTKVKICGIRRLEDALVAAEAGADLIGLVFVPGRPRRVDIATASAIVAGVKAGVEAGARSKSKEPPGLVGLFADQPLDEVNQTIEACGLDLVQLCGDESTEYCEGARAKVIKVLHVPGSAHAPASQERKGGGAGLALGSLETALGIHSQAGRLVTLDRLVDGIPGGSGQGFDWTIAAGLSRGGHSFILAGGLSPETVGRAIEEVQPWGVDVSSGVETAGVKDPEKIRAFIRNARNARNAPNAGNAQNTRLRDGA